MIFKCKNCGGQVTYNPIKAKLICNSCDSSDSEEKIESEKPKNCINCGVVIDTKEYTSATKCSSCGGYVILDDMIKYPHGPNVILPFFIDKDGAADILVKQFKKSLFLPNDFLSVKSLEYLSGEYVPFWLYNIDSDIDYNAVGVKVRTWTTGDTEYTETSKYAVNREIDISFTRVPVDASIAMDDTIMDIMEPYDYKMLKSFLPDYLSGFYSETYNYVPDELLPRAKKKAAKDSEEWLKTTIKQYTRMENVRKNINLNRTKQEFALLPVWKYTYRYDNKNYDFYVNGQSGKTYGKSPVSIAKLFGYSGIVLGLVSLLMFAVEKVLEVL